MLVVSQGWSGPLVVVVMAVIVVIVVEVAVVVAEVVANIMVILFLSTSNIGDFVLVPRKSCGTLCKRGGGLHLTWSHGPPCLFSGVSFPPCPPPRNFFFFSFCAIFFIISAGELAAYTYSKPPAGDSLHAVLDYGLLRPWRNSAYLRLTPAFLAWLAFWEPRLWWRGATLFFRCRIWATRPLGSVPLSKTVSGLFFC